MCFSGMAQALQRVRLDSAGTRFDSGEVLSFNAKLAQLVRAL